MFLFSKTTVSVLDMCLRNSLAASNVFQRTSLAVLTNIYKINYATDTKKTPKLSGAGSRVKEFPVETDTHKLVNYCCGSNYFITGEDVKLQPESEYPDWLWEINSGPPPKLEDLEPNSKAYWEMVRVLARRRKNRLHRLNTKVIKYFR